MAFWSWSRTAASNATADVTINYSEGQAPSSLNDSARAAMARLAEYRDDVAGAITTGGSATAYTVTSYQVFDSLAHLNGQMIAFVPHATNTNTVGADVTLNVDSLGAKSIRMQPGVALPNGALVLGTPYVVVYNSSDAVFYLRNMVNPYSIPLAAGFEFWGTTAPNSSFAFPVGQAISRTTYATLFALTGTTYGAGDGSTTFNLPDPTGRVRAVKEASVSRITSNGWSGNSSILGSTGGADSITLTTNEMPTHTHAVTDPQHSHSYNITTIPGGSGLQAGAGATTGTTGSTTGSSS